MSAKCTPKCTSRTDTVSVLGCPEDWFNALRTTFNARMDWFIGAGEHNQRALHKTDAPNENQNVIVDSGGVHPILTSPRLG